MGEKKLESFKITDAAAAKKGAGGKKEAALPSAGFPLLEALVEVPSPNTSGLVARQAALLDASHNAEAATDKGKFARAALAYAHTLKLVEHLLHVKAQLIAAQKKRS